MAIRKTVKPVFIEKAHWLTSSGLAPGPGSESGFSPCPGVCPGESDDGNHQRAQNGGGVGSGRVLSVLIPNKPKRGVVCCICKLLSYAFRP